MHCRSHKRKFDESDTSGEDVASGVEGSGSQNGSNSAKRTKRGPSAAWDGDRVGGADADAREAGNVVDIVMSVEDGPGADGDGVNTPSLSGSVSVLEVRSEAERDGEGAAEVVAEVDEDLTAKLPSTFAPISQPSSSSPLLATPTTSSSTSVVLPEGLGPKTKQKYPHVDHHRRWRGARILHLKADLIYATGTLFYLKRRCVFLLPGKCNPLHSKSTAPTLM